MKTVSLLMQTLCVPCACRCRHCLLSWSGRPVGAEYARSEALAARYARWMGEHRPDLAFHFAFGYSMDHPDLLRAVSFLRSIGSPGGTFLPFDGMAFRPEAELADRLRGLADRGVERLNFTFYGLEPCHDRFAGREGDFRYMLRTMALARAAGLRVTAAVALTRENVGQTEELLALLETAGAASLSLFVPHGEGRGGALEPIRLRRRDLDRAGERTRALFPERLFRPEGDWVRARAFPRPASRMLLLSLTPENIGEAEALSPAEVIRRLEDRDDAYYAAFPAPEELADRYGDPAGDGLYRDRDLLLLWRRRFARETGLVVADVTDERFSGSRRY